MLGSEKLWKLPQMLTDAVIKATSNFRRRLVHQSRIDERQFAVLDAMDEGVIAVDAEQRIVLANPAAARLFNFRPQAAQNRRLLEVVQSNFLCEAADRALSSGTLQHQEINIPGVEEQSFDVHVQPLPGKPCAGAVLVMHDITALRRLESIRRDFIANVSHELKTPLSSIKAYTETLRNGALTDRAVSERFLARIEEQSERLYRLIMDMLELARIESDQRSFDIVSLDIAELATKSLDEYRHAATAKQISLAIEADQNVGQAGPVVHVQADREGLRQILGNLLDNALKYTPEGGKVSLAWQDDAGMVRIKVRDTGFGIPPEDQRRVFERFYRVDHARSRQLGGTGLGLAIVKHLVHSFGGTVSVESEPGQGSTFTVALPHG